jgi:cytochrome P450
VRRCRCSWSATNRDQRHWEGPDGYDIGRCTVDRVGSGGGIHPALARLEGECVLSALARWIAAIEIAGPIRTRYIARTGQLAGDRAL